MVRAAERRPGGAPGDVRVCRSRTVGYSAAVLAALVELGGGAPQIRVRIFQIAELGSGERRLRRPAVYLRHGVHVGDRSGDFGAAGHRRGNLSGRIGPAPPIRSVYVPGGTP